MFLLVVEQHLLRRKVELLLGYPLVVALVVPPPLDEELVSGLAGAPELPVALDRLNDVVLLAQVPHVLGRRSRANA